jgi:ABC-type multidrug transport system fused ATPase/permease subunit
VLADTAEALDGAAVLQAYGAVEQTWASIDASGARSERRGVEAETWSSMAGPLVELAGALGIALVIALAWTTGRSVDFATAGTVLVALLLMYRPLHGLAQSLFGWWSGLASLDRLDELWSLESRAAERTGSAAEAFASLGMSELRFDYDGREVLRGVSASFRAGELIAITGESGAGKSTLLAALAGVLPLSEGEVLIDGVRVSRGSRMDSSAWMPQTPALFGDTILNNVALGQREPDRERVIEVCKRVDAHAFITARPRAYDGVLHEGGSDLSTGQRQRIALARALYRGATCLLLDEPSSALDGEHEQNVIRVCRDYAERGGLVVVATHREDFLRCADRVLELRDGVVNEWERRTEDAVLH